MNRMFLLIPAFCLLLPAGPAMADNATPAAPASTIDTKAEKQTDIVADQMEVLDKEHRATFKGNVDLKRDDVHLTCDQLVVDYEEITQADGTSKTEVKTLDATGNVVIVTKSQTVTGEWAKMDVKENKLQVGGKVKVVQGKSVLYGELLNTDLDTNKSEMTGGRVRGTFLPK